MIKSTGVVKQIQALQIFNENLQNEFKKQILVFDTPPKQKFFDLLFSMLKNF